MISYRSRQVDTEISSVVMQLALIGRRRLDVQLTCDLDIEPALSVPPPPPPPPPPGLGVPAVVVTGP